MAAGPAGSTVMGWKSPSWLISPGATPKSPSRMPEAVKVALVIGIAGFMWPLGLRKPSEGIARSVQMRRYS